MNMTPSGGAVVAIWFTLGRRQLKGGNGLLVAIEVQPNNQPLERNRKKLENTTGRLNESNRFYRLNNTFFITKSKCPTLRDRLQSVRW